MTDVLSILINAQNNTERVLRSTGVDLENLEKKAKSVREKGLDVLNSGFDKVKELATGAAIGVGIAAGALTGYGVNLAISYEQQLSSIKALTGASQEQITQVSALSKKLGEDTKFSALEAAQGAEELLKAGVSLQSIMGGSLKGALDLAAAGGINVADAAEIASTVLNAFKADNLSVSQSADILAGAANASATSVGELKFGLSAVSAVASGVGMSFKDTATALSVFANNGLKGSDAGTSLKTMLMNLQPGTKEQKKLFDQLGITTNGLNNKFFDSQGRLKSLADISGTLRNALGKMNEMQRQAALEQLFGSDAIRAANILYKEGADGVKEMAGEMSKFTAAQVAAEKTNNLAGAIERVKATIDTKLIDLFEGKLPNATTAFNKLADAIGALDLTGLDQAFGTVLSTLEAIGNFWNQYSTLIIVGLGAVTGGVIGLGVALGIANILAIGASLGATTFAGSLWAIAAATWAVMAPILPFIALGALVVGTIVALYLAWNNNFFGIRDITFAVFNAITGFIQSSIDSASNYIKTGIDLVLAIFNFLSGRMTQTMSVIWEYVSKIWESIKLYLSAAFLTIYYLFTGQTDKISEVWGAFSNKIQEIWGGLWETVKSTLSNAWNSVWTYLTDRWNDLSKIDLGKIGSDWMNGLWNSARNAGTAGWNSTWSFITSSFDSIRRINLWEVGKNIIDGLWNGLKAGWGNVSGWFNRQIQNLIDSAKRTLGIQSPSRVFMQIGAYTSEGFAKGIEGNLSTVQSAATSMSGTAASAATNNSRTISTTNNNNTTSEKKFIIEKIEFSSGDSEKEMREKVRKFKNIFKQELGIA